MCYIFKSWSHFLYFLKIVKYFAEENLKNRTVLKTSCKIEHSLRMSRGAESPFSLMFSLFNNPIAKMCQKVSLLGKVIQY